MPNYRPLPKRDADWIKALRKELFPGDGSRRMIRGLKRHEWARIRKMIAERSLPVTLHACVYGFGMQIYDHPKPGKKKPPGILMIDNGYFRKNGQQVFAAEESCMKNRIKPIAYRKANKQILKEYGFEALKEPGHYCY